MSKISDESDDVVLAAWREAGDNPAGKIRAFSEFIRLSAAEDEEELDEVDLALNEKAIGVLEAAAGEFAPVAPDNFQRATSLPVDLVHNASPTALAVLDLVQRMGDFLEETDAEAKAAHAKLAKLADQ